MEPITVEEARSLIERVTGYGLYVFYRAMPCHTHLNAGEVAEMQYLIGKRARELGIVPFSMIELYSLPLDVYGSEPNGFDLITNK